MMWKLSWGFQYWAWCHFYIKFLFVYLFGKEGEYLWLELWTSVHFIVVNQIETSSFLSPRGGGLLSLSNGYWACAWTQCFVQWDWGKRWCAISKQKNIVTGSLHQFYQLSCTPAFHPENITFKIWLFPFESWNEKTVQAVLN